MAVGSQVWFNGKMMSADEARPSLFTHGLHYGTGAFEGIRAYKQTAGGGAIFRLEEHMVRLLDSLKILGLSTKFSVKQLCEGAIAVAKANRFDECYLRPLAYIGTGPLGLNPGKDPPVDVAIVSWEWGSYLGDEGLEKGIRAQTSSYIRPHVASVMTKGKITGQYVTSVLARREAVKAGFEEAIFLDTEGYVAEGTGENIFIVRDGKVKTTPLTAVLAGITRTTVMALLQQRKIQVEETRFTRDELWCADEVFLCGTAAEITPVREIDHRTIGEGKLGPISAQVQKDYRSVVRGEDPEFARDWLTPIR